MAEKKNFWAQEIGTQNAVQKFGALSPDGDVTSNVDGSNDVWIIKFNPNSNQLKVISSDLVRPNGIAFSNDEKKLYIADTGEGINCILEIR